MELTNGLFKPAPPLLGKPFAERPFGPVSSRCLEFRVLQLFASQGEENTCLGAFELRALSSQHPGLSRTDDHVGAEETAPH